ncbi:MAG: hypothetical protein M3N16_01790 [Actinomycetota bacterium]|nr:hypothetical protein [Actinomycetota bacterium]
MTALAASTAVVASIIAAAASICGALITAVLAQRIKRRNDEQLERLKAELSEAKAERDAARDYRYDAIKRLYTDLQPLLFQLSSLCESTYLHTRGLARTARNGGLGTGPDSWLRDDYFLLSTVYRLLVPAAVVQLIQRRLTLVDLSVDQTLHERYRLARLLVATWNSGFDIAASEPPLEYHPHDRDAELRADAEPAVYGLQHLYAGQVEALTACLVVRDAPDEPLRHRTYGEFEREFREGVAREAVAPAVDLISTLHPRTHPVLWRMLLVQAHVARALAGAGERGSAEPFGLPDEERAKFDWRERGAAETDEEAVGNPLRGARGYLEHVLSASPLG